MATMAAIDPISTKRRFAEFFDQRSAQSYGFKGEMIISNEFHTN